MTSGGNNFNDFFLRINWPSFNLEARPLRSCIRLLHHFNTICTQPRNGAFGVLEMPSPWRGTMRPKYGTSREIRDGWQPYPRPLCGGVQPGLELATCESQIWYTSSATASPINRLRIEQLRSSATAEIARCVKRPSKVTQGHLLLCQSTRHIWLPISTQ